MEEISIEERKKILLKILDDIDSFCKRNNLVYLLSYGSLLGAVRHNGFIPWDDDIDIIMPRPDYEKFIKTYANNRYALSSYRNKGKYPHMFAKVYDVNTSAILYEKIQCGYGVAVDIFPVDGIPSQNTKSTDFFKHYKKLEKLYMRCFYYEQITEIRNIKNLLQRVFKILVGTRRMAAMIEKHVSTYSYETAEYAGNILATAKLEKLPKRIYENVVDYQFEDRKYKGPSDYNTMLTAQYGSDYMIPPPEDKRSAFHEERYFFVNQEKQ